MPRQARLDTPGTLHHVIIREMEKRRIVDDDQDRKNLIERLGLVALDTQTRILAWSMLKNHAHVLLKSGPRGLSRFMRRFLTGYAITYNLRHRRHGHLFQNRYKSIACDEDTYFKELVRYIHLNPLRANLVEGLGHLDRYPWCGHAVLVGKIQYPWQDSRYVLSWFGHFCFVSHNNGFGKIFFRSLIKKSRHPRWDLQKKGVISQNQKKLPHFSLKMGIIKISQPYNLLFPQSKTKGYWLMDKYLN